MRRKVSRPGRPLRQMMDDPRWGGLPLAARALWVEMSVMADTHPALRTPTEVACIGLDRLAEHIHASPAETLGALSYLSRAGIAAIINPDTVMLRAF